MQVVGPSGLPDSPLQDVGVGFYTHKQTGILLSDEKTFIEKLDMDAALELLGEEKQQEK